MVVPVWSKHLFDSSSLMIGWPQSCTALSILQVIISIYHSWSLPPWNMTSLGPQDISPTLSLPLHQATLSLLCYFLWIFLASKYWSVPGSNLKLAPSSLHSHLLAVFICSPNFNPRLVEAWVIPLIVSHISLPTWHLQLAIELQTLHSLSCPTKN